jgi:soluble lytic murein transglycosylase-like protein
MPELKTTRPFQDRFLDGYNRSQLRQEVQKAKPKRLSGLRKKYAGWALGASLALGGMGIPLKVGTMLKDADSTTSAAAQRNRAAQNPQQEATGSVTDEIAGDMKTAQNIASQVADGVTGAVSEVGKTVASAPVAVAQEVVKAPTQVAQAADSVKQQFFRKEVPFGDLIYKEAKKNDLPPELVAAVVHTESKFNPTARSGAGAQGLMQLVPRTGRWLGANNLMNPTQNVQAGAKYLRYLTDRFHGDQQKAIAAYNAGEGNVRRFGGVPPFKETRNYVQRVKSFQQELGERQDNASQVADAGAVQ